MKEIFSTWGNQPMPCVNCDHQSRDHNRHKKQSDGSYNGPCTYPDCNCKLYVKPKKICNFENGEYV